MDANDTRTMTTTASHAATERAHEAHWATHGSHTPVDMGTVIHPVR